MTGVSEAADKAGKKVRPEDLVNVPKLVSYYYAEKPNADHVEEQVAFGTSGHRGSSLKRTFNEDHVLATAQAICDYRVEKGIDGPLYLGIDTHALSEPAFITTLQVLAANKVDVMIDAGGGYTTTPAVSLAILKHNRGGSGKADGIVITPSHNPPEDGGYKYNPPSGGPADTDITAVVQDRANRYLKAGLDGVKTVSFAQARAASTTREFDFNKLYVGQLETVLNLEKIKASGIKAAVDPLGGAGLACWQRLIEEHGLPIEVVNTRVDPTFSFMYVDWDGKVRMDCSSPYAMAGLLSLKDKYDIAFANDTDHDRHGIVTPEGGLMNPNHYLAVAIQYLFGSREGWSKTAAIGKTLVSSSMIDRVAKKLGRKLIEVPVGFKWFVDGLLDGSVGFGGEESAGASFLRKDGTVWTTDKDGIILALLSAEILAETGKDPYLHYRDLTKEFGEPAYARIDAPATSAEKKKLKALSSDQVKATELAGEQIVAKLTEAPGNGAPIGGLKVVTEAGWFAARPSGTEDVYKIYAESFKGEAHLKEIQEEAKKLVASVLNSPIPV